MDSISLVIPALNEEERIVKNLLEICSFLDNINNLEYEIIVVNDGSTDSTSREVNELGKTHKNISEDLEIPLGTVKSKIRNILNKMRKPSK